MKTVNFDYRKFYSLDTPCETGEIFLILLILHSIRSYKNVCISFKNFQTFYHEIFSKDIL